MRLAGSLIRTTPGRAPGSPDLQNIRIADRVVTRSVRPAQSGPLSHGRPGARGDPTRSVRAECSQRLGLESDGLRPWRNAGQEVGFTHRQQPLRLYVKRVHDGGSHGLAPVDPVVIATPPDLRTYGRVP